ncbi:MAG: hypothetical protein LAT64_02995 [Phycisphaerales bacterium]|nr:hypothetical protein [Planctomycetota bacterium]MCH8507723.1 hypothetical protein [Phycisphaerales bacterium]
MSAPEHRLLAERLSDSEPGPEIPAEFLNAVRARRRAVVRARTARMGGVGAAAAIGLVVWINAPRSGQPGPEVVPPIRSGVVATAGTASDQSLGAMQRDWATTGQLPVLTRTRSGRPDSETLRFGDARLMVSTDG